jgi:pimeloyl-ACP methyl ester carboxylesterase
MVATPNKVVVVPGLGGTQLFYRGGFGGFTNYWYNPPIMLSSNPLTAALASDGISPYPVLGKQLYPGGPVDLGIYEPLMTSLANANFNPVFWGYDWRLSLTTLQAQFVAFLNAANLTSPFYVVAHSMGGLVAQLAYPTYQLGAKPFTWQRTVYVGTPHGGCHMAAAALAGWFPDYSQLKLFAEVFNLSPPLVPGLKQSIITTTMTLLGQLFGSWPSLYDLLPNYNGYWQSADPNASQLAQLATYASTWGGQTAGGFADAVATLGFLVTNLTQPRPQEVCIYGSGFSTPSTYNGTPNNPGYTTSYSNSDGDGTVLDFRAQLPPPIPSVEVMGISHLDLVRSNTGNVAIISALGAQPVGSTVDIFVPPIQPPAKKTPPPSFTPVLVNPFANTHGDP